jgi:gamma-glutamylcyclotransferase (GGCT)/AIG2-like uncharacterized protein YtfP
MVDHLFVYGTLRQNAGHPMARWLAGRAQLLGQATMQGKLYLLGAYPGMLPSDNPLDVVRGELYQLPDPAGMFETLDEYEGIYQFQRGEGVARYSTGEPVRCWVYFYRSQPPESSRIVSGDFLAR